MPSLRADISEPVTIVGGGLAGTEAALQLATRGIPVRLYEMRPLVQSPAHHTGMLSELVCSNSLKGLDPTSASGQLKWELESLGSHVLRVAHETAVPAGGALAVDRDAFSERLTTLAQECRDLEVIRAEVREIPEGDAIIATGPLTSASMENALSMLIGDDRLAFFDAAAPIVEAVTVDSSVVFPASRYDKGGGADYLNCPLDRVEYERFIGALVAARRVREHEFERRELFAACQPIEEVARTGLDAARFGALKPVGIVDPRTGQRPWAVVQLRAENRERTAYNLVGFQTNLTFSEQERVFHLIPGLEHAEFLRFGVMHRNTYVDAPRLLDPSLSLRVRPETRIAGQLAGTEGYLEAAAAGLLAALNVIAARRGVSPFVLPRECALGALIAYATDADTADYQPMHVNWGLVPPFESRIKGKRERYAAYAARARDAFSTYVNSHVLTSRDSSIP